MVHAQSSKFGIFCLLVIFLLVSGGGCGGGGSSSGGLNTINSSIRVGTASDQSGFSISAVNGEGTFNSSVSFQVASGTHSLILQSNIDGNSEPMLKGVSVIVTSPTGSQTVNKLNLTMGSGAVSNTGGMPLPSLTGTAAQFSTDLKSRVNCVASAQSQNCHCSGGSQVGQTALAACVINPEPGKWQVRVVGKASPRFTLGVVVSGLQDLSGSDTQTALANQVYSQVGIPVISPNSRLPYSQGHHCGFWKHTAIALACEVPTVFAEDAFIAMIIAIGVLQPETIPADAILILSFKAAYRSYWSTGCANLTDKICEENA